MRPFKEASSTMTRDKGATDRLDALAGVDGITFKYEPGPPLQLFLPNAANDGRMRQPLQRFRR
jgi:hypothetical protein